MKAHHQPVRFPLVPFSESGEVQYINLEVLEERARHKLEKQAYDYYRSGSETQSTLLDNRAAFARYRMLPRIMVNPCPAVPVPRSECCNQAPTAERLACASRWTYRRSTHLAPYWVRSTAVRR